MTRYCSLRVITVTLAAAFVLGGLGSGCGKGKGTVTLKSASYLGLAGTTTKTNVTEFKICVKFMTFFDEAGVQIDASDTHTLATSTTLVNISDAAEKSWGTLSAPVGRNIKTFKVLASADSTACPDSTGTGGINVVFNGYSQLNGDVTFSWTFANAIELKEGDTIQLSMQAFADALADKVIAATLTNSNVKETVEAVTTAVATKP